MFICEKIVTKNIFRLSHNAEISMDVVCSLWHYKLPEYVIRFKKLVKSFRKTFGTSESGISEPKVQIFSEKIKCNWAHAKNPGGQKFSWKK